MAALRAGALEGSLTLDAFAERVRMANEAHTGEELDGLVADLPGAAGRLRRVLGTLRPGSRGARELEVRVRPGAAKVTVGRASQCDVVVGESSVSRFHAELRHAAGRWFVHDLDSENGTWLNGRRVREAPVMRGDVLRLGGLRLDLRL